jgi:hypothetical protein
MILVDTSIWIDHLHHTEGALSALLNDAQVSTHPMIIGELALSSLRNRTTILGLLSDLPRTPVATPAEVLAFVELHALYGRRLESARCPPLGCAPPELARPALDARRSPPSWSGHAGGGRRPVDIRAGSRLTLTR